MAYVNEADFETYLSTYGGTDITDESNFDELLELSSLDIETTTYNRFDELNDLTSFQQTHIKNAVCSHAQTLNDYGDMTQHLNETRAVELGDLSVEGSRSSVMDRMSERTKAFLFKTGLASKSLSYGASRGYWDRL